MAGRVQAEFSRIVDLDGIAAHAGATVFEIEAAESERRALAVRFGLAAIETLAARVTLQRIDASEVMLSADISADVVQTCVRTLEPVANRIQERVDLAFSAAANPSGRPRTAEFAADDDLEPLPEGAFDIGEIVAEELSLLLDSYPRKAGGTAQRGEPEYAVIHEERPDTPFGALAGLRRKD